VSSSVSISSRISFPPSGASGQPYRRVAVPICDGNHGSGAPTGASAGSARPKRIAFAEFETALRKERQAEGIAKAKAAGIYKGRPVTIKAETIAEVKRLKHEEKRGATYITKALNISRVSVYRALAT
jgi:hypothetical protein